MNIENDATFELIESSASFEQFSQQHASCRHVALDTEFVRTSTFYALLGLIQMADDNDCYLVDPLAMEDKNSLCNYLNDSDRVLVLHSCSEDLNLLYTALDVTPAAMFDTQIAAAFLGLGFSLSYQALVREFLGIDIPKDETRSDWLKRPLTDRQKIYAATDVKYLLELRKQMQAQLQERGVFEWFEQECRDLLELAPLSELPSLWNDGYATINNAWRLSDDGLRCLKILYVWREEQARKRNKPRNWIAKDADMLQIAASMSSLAAPSLAELQSVVGIDKHVLKRYGNELIHLLNAESIAGVKVDRTLLNNPLSNTARKKLKLCQRAVQNEAETLGIAPELLGRKKIILELVRDYEENGAVTWSSMRSQWRRTILEPLLSPILVPDSALSAH